MRPLELIIVVARAAGPLAGVLLALCAGALVGLAATATLRARRQRQARAALASFDAAETELPSTTDSAQRTVIGTLVRGPRAEGRTSITQRGTTPVAIEHDAFAIETSFGVVLLRGAIDVVIGAQERVGLSGPWTRTVREGDRVRAQGAIRNAPEGAGSHFRSARTVVVLEPMTDALRLAATSANRSTRTRSFVLAAIVAASTLLGLTINGVAAAHEIESGALGTREVLVLERPDKSLFRREYIRSDVASIVLRAALSPAHARSVRGTPLSVTEQFERDTPRRDPPRTAPPETTSSRVEHTESTVLHRPPPLRPYPFSLETLIDARTVPSPAAWAYFAARTPLRDGQRVGVRVAWALGDFDSVAAALSQRSVAPHHFGALPQQQQALFSALQKVAAATDAPPVATDPGWVLTSFPFTQYTQNAEALQRATLQGAGAPLRIIEQALEAARADDPDALLGIRLADGALKVAVWTFAIQHGTQERRCGRIGSSRGRIAIEIAKTIHLAREGSLFHGRAQARALDHAAHALWTIGSRLANADCDVSAYDDPGDLQTARLFYSLAREHERFAARLSPGQVRELSRRFDGNGRW